MKVRRASLISITQGSFEWFRLPPSCLRWRGVAGCASVRNVSLRFLAVKIHAPCLCAATENNQIFSPPSITAALLGHSSLFSSFSLSLFLATQLTFESPPKREPPIPQHLGYIHFQFPKPPSYLFFLLSIPISFMILFIVLRRVCGQRPIVCYVEKARNRFLEYKASMSFVQRIVLTLYKLRRRRRRLYRFLHNSISFRTLRSDVSFFIHQLFSSPHHLVISTIELVVSIPPIHLFKLSTDYTFGRLV